MDQTNKTCQGKIAGLYGLYVAWSRVALKPVYNPLIDSIETFPAHSQKSFVRSENTMFVYYKIQECAIYQYVISKNTRNSTMRFVSQQRIVNDVKLFKS